MIGEEWDVEYESEPKATPQEEHCDEDVDTILRKHQLWGKKTDCNVSDKVDLLIICTSELRKIYTCLNLHTATERSSYALAEA